MFDNQDSHLAGGSMLGSLDTNMPPDQSAAEALAADGDNWMVQAIDAGRDTIKDVVNMATGTNLSAPQAQNLPTSQAAALPGTSMQSLPAINPNTLQQNQRQADGNRKLLIIGGLAAAGLASYFLFFKGKKTTKRRTRRRSRSRRRR